MYRQSSCIEECVKNGGPYEFCEGWCTGTLEISTPFNPYYMVPTAPYGMKQVAPYSPQPYYYASYPYSYYSGYLPEDDPCVQECKRLNIPTLNCCFRCGYC